MGAPAVTSTKPPAQPTGAIDRWFEISARGSTVAREIRGGLVTFFTMAYILALNPLIIGTAADHNGRLLGGAPWKDAAGQVISANVGHSITLVAGATALVAGVSTIAMGIFGRFPLGLATGLGLNALVAFTIAPQMTWPQAMGLVVIEGVVIAILVLTGFRTAVFRAVPASLRAAISVGIGLFIAFVGLVDSGVVRAASGTPVQLGFNGSIEGWPMLVFAIGLFTVAVLHVRRVRGAMLISIILATIIAVIIQAFAKLPAQSADHPTGWALNIPTLGKIISVPDLSLVGRVDVFGAFIDGGIGRFVPLIMIVFALILSDFFDTMGTVVAIGAEGDLLDEHGNPPHLAPILLVDSLAAAAGGFGSVSSNTTYIESASGVGEGARTGLASVVTGLGFLVAMFLAPLAGLVPSEAASPALVFVGFLMMSQVTKINWGELEEGLPAFLTMALMPFTYSITNGIGAGFLMYVFLKLIRGKGRDIHPLMYAIAVAFLIYFLQGLINTWVS